MSQVAVFHPGRPVPPLVVLLIHWLAIGALVLLLVPMGQWHHPWIGWLPYWLVLVPAWLLLVHGIRRGACAPAGKQ